MECLKTPSKSECYQSCDRMYNVGVQSVAFPVSVPEKNSCQKFIWQALHRKNGIWIFYGDIWIIHDGTRKITVWTVILATDTV